MTTCSQTPPVSRVVADDGCAPGVSLGRLDYLVLLVVHLEAERLAADVVDRAHLLSKYHIIVRGNLKCCL